MYHALIRTHHITSRKKVTLLKSAAKKYDCYAILRSGGVPGVMYVESTQRENVENWIKEVHDLRYKDYQMLDLSEADLTVKLSRDCAGKVDEVDAVKDLGRMMDEKGLKGWFRTAMGFQGE